MNLLFVNRDVFQVVSLMDCEGGSLCIKSYNRSSATTTQISISAIERRCLLGTAHSSGWRQWYNILVCIYTFIAL
jgi:hypothetical protein